MTMDGLWMAYAMGYGLTMGRIMNDIWGGLWIDSECVIDSKWIWTVYGQHMRWNIVFIYGWIMDDTDWL